MSTRKTAPRFTTIKLENWRNFVHVDLTLTARTFLVGPNASGKSNLLDAFRFVRDLVLVRGGGLQFAVVTQRGGMSKLRSLWTRRPDVRIETSITDGRSLWRYVLAFRQAPDGAPIVRQELVEKDGLRLLTRPQPGEEGDPELLKQTHLEQVSRNQQFRELAELFRSVRYFHIVPQLVREPERWDGDDEDPFGGDFLQRVHETNTNVRRARLRRIESALRIAVPQLSSLSVDMDTRKGVPHLSSQFAHWRGTPAKQNEEQLSDGTLRLIGLMWSILDAGGPLLLEEPELSLHAAVVRQIPSLISRMQLDHGRQVIMSTHSPELLRDKGIAPDEVFLFIPGKGTEVASTASRRDILRVLEAGLSMGDALIAKTEPKDVDQLTLAFRA